MGKDMEDRFLPAAEAVRRGDRHALEEALGREPTLAKERSATSHPTLLQCLVLDGGGLPGQTQIAMAAALVDAGADKDEPLIATGSHGNLTLADFLLDQGACLDGRPDVLRGWTVLEEALYWGHADMVDRLLQRGAGVHTLRAAAGLGRVDFVLHCFDDQGRLLVEHAGPVNWPFAELPPEQRSEDPRDLLDNALVYAAMGGHEEVMRVLVSRGASVRAHPRGFHLKGTALHWAALRGNTNGCVLLRELGAELEARDGTFEATPADWARRGDHEALAQELES